jgi:hypothetical protein
MLIRRDPRSQDEEGIGYLYPCMYEGYRASLHERGRRGCCAISMRGMKTYILASRLRFSKKITGLKIRPYYLILMDSIIRDISIQQIPPATVIDFQHPAP